MASAGYSGTPLVRKLGITAGHRVALLDEPDELRDLLEGLPDDVTLSTGLDGTPDVVISFTTRHEDLDARMDDIVAAVHPDRAAWFAWPKKTSSIDSDLDGNVVRAAILATDLVDVKVCAISEDWSGLKAVWRKERR